MNRLESFFPFLKLDLIRDVSLCFQFCSGFLSPEKLLAERVFLLRGDLSRGKSWSLQRLSQPLG